MGNETIKSSEQNETTEQTKAEYKNIKPLDFGPAREAIGKNRLDEIFDTFNENSTTELTTEDKKEIESLIVQLTEGRADKNNTLLEISAFIKDLGSEITKEDLIENLQESLGKQQNTVENTTEHTTEKQKISEKTTENTEQQAKLSRQQNILSLTSSLNTLLPADNSKPYKPLLDQLQTIDPNNPGPEFDQILAQLNDQQTLFAISLDLQKQDQENGTHNFEAFKTSAINLDPSLKDKFQQAETKAKLALGTDTLQNTTTTTQGYKQTSQDGFTTSATLDGKNRTISRADSNYTLNSDIDSTTTAQQEAEKLSNDLTETLKPINKSLETIKAMKDHLNTAQTQGTDFETIKNELQAFDPELYSRLGLNFLNSPDELLHTLTTHENELTTKKTELQANADKAIERLIYNQKEKAKDKDAIKKEALNFIHEIGLDGLPQATTDIIIANINANPQKYGLQKPIDFENGSLGFDTDFGSQEISQNEKQKFIELFNKMLTGSKDYPVKLTNGNITFHSSQEEAKANIPASIMFDIGAFINGKLGSDPITKAMQNLSSKEEEAK